MTKEQFMNSPFYELEPPIREVERENEAGERERERQEHVHVYDIEYAWSKSCICGEHIKN